jgi:hypothetical protein
VQGSRPVQTLHAIGGSGARLAADSRQREEDHPDGDCH